MSGFNQDQGIVGWVCQGNGYAVGILGFRLLEPVGLKEDINRSRDGFLLAQLFCCPADIGVPELNVSISRMTMSTENARRR